MHLYTWHHLHVTHLADPRLKLLIDPDIVTAQEGMLAELVCMVDCFCPGVVPEWSRADNTPLSDFAVVSDNLVHSYINHVGVLSHHYLCAFCFCLAWDYRRSTGIV